MDENTTLGDLLELQLHRVEEEVKNIVDKAVKEMGIEKVERFKVFFRNSEAFQDHNKMYPLCVQILGEIQQTWSMMSLSYETHTSTGTPLLKANENLIETLEDNQVTSFISQVGLVEISFNQFNLNLHSLHIFLLSLVFICSDQFSLFMISVDQSNSDQISFDLF